MESENCNESLSDIIFPGEDFEACNADISKAEKFIKEFGLFKAAQMMGLETSSYDNLMLAGRMSVKHIKLTCPKTILEYLEKVQNILNTNTFNFMKKHYIELQVILTKYDIYNYDYDWFAAHSFITTFSLRTKYKGDPIEYPTLVWLRIAVQFYYGSEDALQKIEETVEMLSKGYYTPASPTIFNAGTKKHQMASCFLIHLDDDLDNILDQGINTGGQISKSGGGLGINLSHIRHSEIGVNGWSKGIVPLLKLFDSLVSYVDQCVDKNTYIYTKSGPVKIKKININDKVLTIDGSFQKVLRVMEDSYSGEMIKINSQFSESLLVTGKHKILTYDCEKILWKNAKELVEEDNMIISTPIKSKSNFSKSFLDVRDFYFYGLLLVDTFFSKILNEFYFSCNGKEDIIIEYLKYLSIDSEVKNNHLVWYSTDKFNLPSHLFKKNKIQIHESFMYLDIPSTFNIIKGILDSSKFEKDFGYCVNNYYLAEQLKYLLLRVGIKAKVRKEEFDTFIHFNFEIYENLINIIELNPLDENIFGNIRAGMMQNNTITSISTEMVEKRKIYDLEIENNSNYCTSLGLVHNGGRRKGVATLFLPIFHYDIVAFIDTVRNSGDQNTRNHNINCCIWMNYFFFERLREDKNWTVFCPHKAPQLNNNYGNNFRKVYEEAENNTSLDSYKKVYKARELFDMIISAQKESGQPYMMNGDAVNFKSNHKHMGMIKASNLCLEIVQYTDKKNISVCNLHNISLRHLVKRKLDINNNFYKEEIRNCLDFELLKRICKSVVRNLNKVIDENWYPKDKHDENGNLIEVGSINISNKRDRPVGIGVSGFAEMIHALDLSFEDEIVSMINKMIFAAIYWNCLTESMVLGVDEGVYETFKGSPTSEGKLQFDLWKEEFEEMGPNIYRTKEDEINNNPLNPTVWGETESEIEFKTKKSIKIQPNWNSLKEAIKVYGLRNSLLVALMPTAGTSQIRRNCETVEAHQNNFYSRKLLNGSYPIINRYLINDLKELNIWNHYTLDYLTYKNGSIQDFHMFVKNNLDKFENFTGNYERLKRIEKKYKTMWELSQKIFLNLSAERSRYIDQSSSSNIYLKNFNSDKLIACLIYSVMIGLKTNIYYLRQSVNLQSKLTINTEFKNMISNSEKEKIQCDKDICYSCS